MDRHDLLNVADDKAKKEHNEHHGGAVFVVSNRPLVPPELRGEAPVSAGGDYENLGELPGAYGRPVLFGIARDSHTLFLYWEIDWKNLFAHKPPADRKAYLRVRSADESEETKVVVEPFAASQNVAVAHARCTYDVELGYYDLAGAWNSVATSEGIATPPDDVSELRDIDVATVPFHLNFQRLIDAFRGSKYDRRALVEIIAQLQKRADALDETLTEADRELLRAIGSTSSEDDAIQRSRLRESDEAFASREKIEAILGFGTSSPMG